MQELNQTTERYLANEVFRICKGRWKQQIQTDVPPLVNIAGGTIQKHPLQSRVIVRHEFKSGVSAPDPDLGIKTRYAILVVRELYDFIEFEVPAEAWFQWVEALRTRARVVWRKHLRDGVYSLERNESVPPMSATVGVSLVRRLVRSGLIVPVQGVALREFEALRASVTDKKPESVYDVVAGAVGG